MLQKTGLYSVAVTAVLLLVGCGDSDTAGDIGTGDPLSLDGTWSNGLETKTFSDTNFSTAMAFDTSDMQYDVNGSGTLDINGTKQIQPNDITVTKIELTYTSCSSTTTYKRQDLVDNANTFAYCGYNDWLIDVQKDTSACACFDKKDIYNIDTTGIRFGDYDLGVDADGYPEGLSTYYLYRQ
ncbi:MAG: hypothetical protein ABFR02_10110 [Campylobacterota bacterium]